MNLNRRTCLALLGAASLSLVVAAPALSAQKAAKKEFAFRGTVEKVDAKAKTLTVNGETVEGWMMGMTMTYGVDKAEVIDQVKAGDKITAKVYEGDFQKLYEVKVAAAPKK